MRFVCEYKTPDNVRRECLVVAASRDAVYKSLKERGIRPSRVIVAPGICNNIIYFLFNVNYRWVVSGLLGLMCVLVLIFLCYSISVDRKSISVDRKSQDDIFKSVARRQIVGDPIRIADEVRSGWRGVFSNHGERFLASFAIPGVPAGLRNASEQQIHQALKRRILPEDRDSIETIQIKCMVEGMKDELRRYLKDGGSVVEYGAALVARQEQELAIYNSVRDELNAAYRSGLDVDKLQDLWMKKNSGLRKLGIRHVPFPGDE